MPDRTRNSWHSPSAGRRSRHPGHPGPARPQQAGEHRPLHQGGDADSAHRGQANAATPLGGTWPAGMAA